MVYSTIGDSEENTALATNHAVAGPQASMWKFGNVMRSTRNVLGVAAAVAAFIVAGFWVYSSHGTGSGDNGAVVATTVGLSLATTASMVRKPIGAVNSPPPSVTACTFDQCYATRCNGAVAPYTCLFHNGGPHGGCSPIPWTKETCEVQCDLTDCGSLEIPDTTQSCAGVECTEDWCEQQHQLCPGAEVPFQCTSGSARFGCSNDQWTWTLKTDSATCNQCCDTTTCK